MTTRAKFHCFAKIPYNTGFLIKLSCLYDPAANPEDTNFTKATPWGTVEMFVDNPEAALQFEEGKLYYADFTLKE